VLRINPATRTLKGKNESQSLNTPSRRVHRGVSQKRNVHKLEITSRTRPLGKEDGLGREHLTQDYGKRKGQRVGITMFNCNCAKSLYRPHGKGHANWPSRQKRWLSWRPIISSSGGGKGRYESGDERLRLYQARRGGSTPSVLGRTASVREKKKRLLPPGVDYHCGKEAYQGALNTIQRSRKPVGRTRQRKQSSAFSATA